MSNDSLNQFLVFTGTFHLMIYELLLYECAVPGKSDPPLAMVISSFKKVAVTLVGDIMFTESIFYI